MEYIYIGDIVNTHGIKGELRIVSHFKHKDMIFLPNFKFYIGKRKEELNVTHHRFHKIYDMVTFEGITDINDAIVYKGDRVYIKREDISKDIVLDEDLINLDVYAEDKLIGKVETIMQSAAHDIIVVVGNNKKHMIPYVEEFILNIDLKNNKLEINVIEGLLNEN